jgi:thiol:disulfide interchange protein
MRKAHKPFWFILAVLCGLILIIGISRTNSAPEIIPWRTDFAAARREAASTGKPLFAYFTASWCGPCQRLKHTTWADADVEQSLQGYVPVEIDIDAHRDLAARYSPDSIPTFVVLDRNGAVIKSESGALPPDEFLAWLNGSPSASHSNDIDGPAR